MLLRHLGRATLLIQHLVGWSGYRELLQLEKRLKADKLRLDRARKRLDDIRGDQMDAIIAKVSSCRTSRWNFDGFHVSTRLETCLHPA